ncbi:hypothetical protein BV408_03610 [Klebsiella pneumoniae]|nr:LysR family transcriptional regulator [Klebsiella pneumoniae]OCN29529.1 hypothetical protein AN657_0205300 [Klebsiella pneumoniae subsp. pneumoniae]KSY65700.1 hypothetical protein APU09_07625 [Klebsiella pneumoniae]OCN40281.1 hypothetical protein AN656_0207345 [Klebsiella pneumoniae subsp. pneumoniae]OCN59325.1 hypothetical protein AN675_0220625 [Klebsiella pneumoniae subsp. pneumoniae]
MLAQRRRAIAAGTEPLLCRAASDALPGLRCVRPAVKLPTRPAETAGVAASTSLRRSRKAGAARMDAG